MVITSEAIGQRLRFARESRQMTQESSATLLGLQRSAISLMESGQRQVSTLELTRLAAHYGRPIEWFVNPLIPAHQEDPVVALFRAAPDLQGRSGSGTGVALSGPPAGGSIASPTRRPQGGRFPAEVRSGAASDGG